MNSRSNILLEDELLEQMNQQLTRKQNENFSKNKVLKVRKQLRLKGEQQKKMYSHSNLQKGIYFAIINKINQPKVNNFFQNKILNQLRIHDLIKILNQFNIAISNDLIEKLFHLSDHNRDYALHLEEFIWMIQSEECNRLYSNEARSIIKHNQTQFLKAIIILQKYLLAEDTIPLTLTGFFFHLAHLLCRGDLQQIAYNENNMIEERFTAMTSLLRLQEVNNTLLDLEGTYDEELKQKLYEKQKFKEIEFISPSISQIDHDSKNNDKFTKIDTSILSVQDSILNSMPSVLEKNSFEKEINDLVRKAKKHTKSVADSSLITNQNHISIINNKLSFKLKLPYVYNISPLTDEKGRLRQKYRIGQIVSNQNQTQANSDRTSLPQLHVIPGELIGKIRAPSLNENYDLDQFDKQKKALIKKFESENRKLEWTERIPNFFTERSPKHSLEVYLSQQKRQRNTDLMNEQKKV